MNNFKKTAVAGATATAMLLNTIMPAFAATTITISGNGADTDNDADVVIKRDTNVVQDNNSNIVNKIEVDAETGDNDANRNTGGDVKIDTGDATSDVKVTNSTNSNVADIAGCDCDEDTTVEISNNGDNSNNDADLKNISTTDIIQHNKASVTNDIESDAETGENDANRNTDGDIEINTGNATSNVDVSTAANTNVAQKSGHGAGAGSLSAIITGNGADTDNDIDLTHKKSAYLDQVNTARVTNDVESDAETGENDANRNTGGVVSIDTGKATIDIKVDNMSNFNAADLDCGCLLDVTAKVAKNGDDSDNDLTAKFIDTVDNFQTNLDRTNNDIEGDAETGENDANKNTAADGEDPSIDTGDSDANVEVNNSNNVNQLGNVDMGGMNYGGSNVQVTFDLTAFLTGLLGL